MHGLTERLLKTIRKQQSIRAGDRLAVAVSGGADSVALLCLLLELRSSWGPCCRLRMSTQAARRRGRRGRAVCREVGAAARTELHASEASVDGSHISGVVSASKRPRVNCATVFASWRAGAGVTKCHGAHARRQAERSCFAFFAGPAFEDSREFIRESFSKTRTRVWRGSAAAAGFRRAALQEFLRSAVRAGARTRQSGYCLPS